MTEYDKAVMDMRKDVIDEVASSMPNASAAQVVQAIVARLSRGLQPLAEVRLLRTGDKP